jgi:hypothetical protein
MRRKYIRNFGILWGFVNVLENWQEVLLASLGD